MKCHTDILILNEFFKKFYSIHDYDISYTCLITFFL